MIAKRHQCMIYDGPPTVNMARLVPQLLQKLEERCRCMFLGSPTMVARMQYELAAAGLKVSGRVEKGDLILSSSQAHLFKGHFDTPRMLGMLKEAVDQALKDGYRGLWATGDMTWEFGSEKNLSKLLDYECGLEELFQTTPALSGICQYHRETLPGHIMWNALLTHPSVFINHTLQRVNPYYVPPDSQRKIKQDSHPPIDIDRILREIIHPEAAA